MKSKLTEMVGCEFPIVAFSHCRDVVAAVTNAGGFGMLGASFLTPEELDIELKWLDERTGGRGDGSHPSTVPDSPVVPSTGCRTLR